MTDPQHAAIEAATRLNESVNGLKDEIRGLQQYGRRNRHYIIGLGISLLFDLLLSVVVIIVAIQANAANDRADANHQYQVDSCNSSNAARQTSRDLWNYVLDAASKNPANDTPERRKQINDFRAYMENSYAPRDCSKVGK
jgi:hypothetical protein